MNTFLARFAEDDSGATSLEYGLIISLIFLAIRFGPHQAAIEGAPSPAYDEAKMSAYMKNPEIEIAVDVGMGRASATVWTCDLTKGYIEINGDYRS